MSMNADPERPFELITERLGPLPIANHFLERLGLDQILNRFVPKGVRCALPYATGLGVLIRSIMVEREPIYRHYETVSTFWPMAFGLIAGQVEALTDDRLGRALDRLFDADRASLFTEVVVKAVQEFDVKLDELHNDSTTIRFTGQYRRATGRSLRGKRAPAITYGFSKDHRSDLKQLLYIMTTSADGSMPVQFRCGDGNGNDATTHIETWEALCRAAGRKDFLYVADCKLCTYENLRHIDTQGGRLVTVMPRNRTEDANFRQWIQTHEPEWEKVWDRENPRCKHGLRDRWYVHTYHLPSREGWPTVWVWSTLLGIKQKKSRLERLTQANEELEDLDRRLQGPRPRLRNRPDVAKAAQDILVRLSVARYLQVTPWQEEIHRFRQAGKGRPGPDTKYRRITKHRWRIKWEVDQKVVTYDEKSDGMYPLLTNDRSLTPAQVLMAHKRQPSIEKRFEQAKDVFEIAPAFLKNEGRIEALFSLYFASLLVQALIEREIRLAMDRENIVELPIYPEDRNCKRPTTQQIFRLFSLVERHSLVRDGEVIQVFDPEFTDLQLEVLRLLGLSADCYRKEG